MYAVRNVQLAFFLLMRGGVGKGEVKPLKKTFRDGCTVCAFNIYVPTLFTDNLQIFEKIFSFASSAKNKIGKRMLDPFPDRSKIVKNDTVRATSTSRRRGGLFGDALPVPAPVSR